MRSTVAFLLTILIASSTSSDETDKEVFDREFSLQIPADDPRRERVLNVMQLYAGCKDRNWSCQKACRAQVPIKGNDTIPYCTDPEPGETCFGKPIDYKYVHSRESLPVQYEVLRRFPKCWSVLAPMLCGMIYRPCGVYEFTARIKSNVQMEVWQRYGIGMCRRVMELCDDAIKEGFFPSDLVDCKQTAENVTWLKQKFNTNGVLARFVPSGNEEELKTEWERHTVFTEENCNIKYTENASRHEPMQCIFPLVYTLHEKITPMIDKCFLPCRSPLISSPDKYLSFVVLRALLCAFFAALCFAIFMFLSARSRIFTDSHCIFSIACCLLCFSIYLVCWGLGSVTYFAQSSECTRTTHGVNIRSTPIDEYASTWCLLSAVVSHSSLLSSIGFLAAAFPLSAAAVSKQTKKDAKKSSDSAGFRAALVALICIASIVCGVVPVFLKMVSTDGIAGVCSFGLHSILHHSAALAFPGLVFCLIAFIVGMRHIWRERKLRQADVDQAVLERICMEIEHQKEHEKSKKKIEFWEDRGGCQKEEIQEKVRQGSLPTVEEKGESEGGRGEIERDGEEEVLVLKGDEKEWLSEDQKRDISDTVKWEMKEEWKEREKNIWHESISTRYTLLALCLCVGSLLFGLAIHSVFLANDGKKESDAIRGYVTCVMSMSIVRKDLHWMREGVHAAEKWDEGREENDPLVRRHNLASEIVIHSCPFPSTGDDRIFGLLSVFILLPLLPVCVFICAFVAGFAGIGGMAMVKERRPKKEKKKRLEDDYDVEMTTLTGHDLESQMMSSVSPTIGDDLIPPPSAPSTLSTILSDVDSSHSSVSLRGRLPRFPSQERLVTERATSPVPSATRSEIVVVPDKRSRSAPHHRRVDGLVRANERKKREKNKKKKRAASSEVMEGRREGQAEAGQLMAPRNAEHDTRSVSSHSTNRTLLSGVSSSLHPPSQMGRRMMDNAEALMSRSRQTSRQNTGMQQQLQMVQEELLLRSLPNDQPSSSGSNQQNPEWFRNLQEVRLSIEGYTTDAVFSDAATSGLMLIGHALNLGRLIIRNGTADCLIYQQILQYALQRLQYLAHHFERRLSVSPQLAIDIQEGIFVLLKQRNIVETTNGREYLTRMYSLNLQLDIESPEAQRLRDEFYGNDTTETRRDAIMDELLSGVNHRAVLRLAAGSLGQLQLQQPQQPQLQQGVQQQQGRPVVYPPSRVVDLTRPPSGMGVPSSSALSLTNSTIPSSALTSAEQAQQARLYHETYGQPSGYEGRPSTSSAGAAVASSSSAAVADNSGAAFIASVLRANGLRANGTPIPSAYAQQSAHFVVPTSSDVDDSHHDEDDDPLSSETSIDSIGRRTPAVASSVFSAGPISGVPIYDVGSPAAALRARGSSLAPLATNPVAAPAPINNLFPSVPYDPSVPSFPGARPTNGIPSLYTTEEDQRRAIAQQYKNQWEEQRRREENGAPVQNGMERLERLEAPSHPLREEGEEEQTRGEKKKVPLSADHPSCSSTARRRNDDPPPRVGRVRVLMPDDGGVNRVVGEMQEQAMNSGASERRAEEDGMADEDSGLESLEALSQLSLRLCVASEDGNTSRPATKEEIENFGRRVQNEVEVRLRREGVLPSMRRGEDEEEARPSNERGRRNRMQLMNRYMNHSNPDLAMEEEEREQREADEEREREERRRVQAARERRERQEREANALPAPDEDEESMTSLMTAEEQIELVAALRQALTNRSIEDLPPDQQRLVQHLRLALDTQGGVSREEIMRYRVLETNRENRRRQQPHPNSPYSVSSVIISRMSLAEIGARVDAIRRLSSSTLYPLEVYYQLHLADVVWPLAGRDMMLGDNVYTHDEINRVLGSDTPLVPAGADSNDFHQLMRKRSITAASLTGRAYGERRGSEGFAYQPPRLPDQGIYRLFGDPSVVLAAIDGDMTPIREAIDRIPLTMPDVMRLDNRSTHTLGSYLRHFRDFLDVQARAAGFALRDDTYQRDEVPQEPTAPSHPTEGSTDGDQPDAQPDPHPDADPDFDPDF